MCRAGGRRCEHEWSSSKREEVNARRRARYAAAKGGSVRSYSRPESESSNSLPAESVSLGGLSSQQAEFFRESKARNADGSLVTVFHGSAHEFNSFNPDTLGRGNDSWGNGFYFTDQEGVAKGYALDSGSPDANVKQFYVDIQNPIMMDGKEFMSIDASGFSFTKQQAVELLKKHPDTYLQPDEDEDRSSFLSDYSPEYWDRESHSPQQFEKMINDAADQYFEDAGWAELEGLYGRDNGQAWLKAVHEITGHDGVIVDFGDAGKHYVAWFPHQMKLTDNANPDSSSSF